jgi:hypothetical protein
MWNGRHMDPPLKRNPRPRAGPCIHRHGDALDRFKVPPPVHGRSISRGPVGVVRLGVPALPGRHPFLPTVHGVPRNSGVQIIHLLCLLSSILIRVPMRDGRCWCESDAWGKDWRGAGLVSSHGAVVRLRGRRGRMHGRQATVLLVDDGLRMCSRCFLPGQSCLFEYLFRSSAVDLT